MILYQMKKGYCIYVPNLIGYNIVCHGGSGAVVPWYVGRMDSGVTIKYTVARGGNIVSFADLGLGKYLGQMI